MQLAINALSSVLSVEFKPTEIEIATVDTKTREFRILSENEIDEHLTRVTEKD